MSPAGKPANAESRSNWDGDGGAFWAEHADRFDRGVAGYQGALLDGAAIAERDRVLDVGCGNGRAALDAARRATAGSVLGVDLSAVMLAVAWRRAAAEGLANVRFEQADAQVHPFPPQRFDVVLSRNGTMFFDDPAAAFGNLARALRAGGRLVMLVWQWFERNEWLAGPFAALGAAPPPPGVAGPTALGDPDRIRSLLDTAGFSDVRIDGLQAPMWFGSDPHDALRFLADLHSGRLRELDPAGRAAALERLRADLARHHDAEHGVRYGSTAWLVRARRG